MDARPPAGATFEVSRIGRGRARAPLGILVWSAALIGLVAAGTLGRTADRPVAGPASASDGPIASAAASQLARPLAALGTDLALVDVIDLQTPAIGPVTLTEPDLTIFGKVLVHAARIEVSLEARNNRVIDTVDVDVSDPDGGVRPRSQPQFEVTFPVPYPRPNGTMWVVVTAYDGRGMPLGGERRPFLVGPIIAARLRILDFRDN